MIDLIRKAATRAYSRFLSWKWDREYHAADERMRGCAHKNTMFVDVGSPPYNCVEKCRDCWALRLPRLGLDAPVPSDEMHWSPNGADPRRACEVAPPRTELS